MKTIIRRFFTTIVCLQLFMIACSSQSNLEINLYKLTLNGLNQKDLTIEQVTDILGRPTATSKFDASTVPQYAYSSLLYHNLGLKLDFRSVDGKVRTIMLYLVRTWDSEYNEFYQPFPGEITPSLNPNLKLSNVNHLFNDFALEYQTTQERRKEWNAKTRRLNLSNAFIKHDVIIIKNDGCTIGIFGEEITKFLEYLSINFNLI